MHPKHSGLYCLLSAFRSSYFNTRILLCAFFFFFFSSHQSVNCLIEQEYRPPEVPSSDAYSWLIHRTFLKRNSEATLRFDTILQAPTTSTMALLYLSLSLSLSLSFSAHVHNRLVDHILSETGGMCEYALFIKATLLRQQGDLHACVELSTPCLIYS